MVEKKRFPNLSLSTLKGLVNDIVHGTANPETYSYGGYIITINNSKDGPIVKNTTPALNRLIKRRDRRSKFLRKRYEERKRKGQCVKCGTDNLGINKRTGKNVTLCPICQEIDNTRIRKSYHNGL